MSLVFSKYINKLKSSKTNQFVVYITFYSGNKLPPFYIGYTTIPKILNGYHGTPTSKTFQHTWNCEIKNNSDKFKTIPIKIFDTRKEALEYESYLHNFFKVDVNEMYINKKISLKQFHNTGGYRLTQKTIDKMKKSFTPERLKKLSDLTTMKNYEKWSDPEYKEKVSKSLSESLKGIPSKMKGIPRKKETREKISIKTKEAMSDPNLKKSLSEKAKARCTEEWKRKISESNKIKLCCFYCGKELPKCTLAKHVKSKRCANARTSHLSPRMCFSEI